MADEPRESWKDRAARIRRSAGLADDGSPASLTREDRQPPSRAPSHGATPPPATSESRDMHHIWPDKATDIVPLVRRPVFWIALLVFGANVLLGLYFKPLLEARSAHPPDRYTNSLATAPSVAAASGKATSEAVSNAEALSVAPNTPRRNVSGFAVSGEIPRVSFRDDAGFVMQLRAARSPVIITGSPVTQWPALRKWSAEQLQKRLHYLDMCYSSSSRVFTYRSHNRTLKALPMRNPYVAESNLMFRLFYTEQHSPTLHYYFSGPLVSWGAAVAREVTPASFLQGGEPLVHADDAARSRVYEPGSDEDEDRLRMSIWMGHPHVVTSMHYDEEHNFYTQVTGRKRFIVTPPTSWPAVYLYPSPHAHSRQSQVDAHPTALRPATKDWESLQALNQRVYPRFAAQMAYPPGSSTDALLILEGVLQPGEVLYLPPFWFHHVEALDFSVSVSTVSQSEDSQAYRDARAVPALMDSSWTLPERVYAVRLHIVAILSALDPAAADHGASYVREHFLESRYRLAMMDPDFATRVTHSLGCSQSAGSIPAALQGSAVLNRVTLPKLSNFAHKVVAALSATSDHGIRDILLDNLLEGYAHWAVGLDLLPEFWSTCFGV